MVTTSDRALGASDLEASELAIFHEQWQIFRKAIDHNYVNHCEAYGWLRRILLDEVARPFRFLDLGCGDASAAIRTRCSAARRRWTTSVHGKEGWVR